MQALQVALEERRQTIQQALDSGETFGDDRPRGAGLSRERVRQIVPK